MHAALHLSPGLVVRWLAVGLALLATLAVGVCAHELLHLVPLSFTDAEYTVSVLPETAGSDSTSAAGLAGFQNLVAGSLVRVEVTSVPDATPDWVLRVAALLPVLLALPLALVAVGALPNPVASGDHVGTAALVALTGSALPSPADWSVVWYGSDLDRD